MSTEKKETPKHILAEREYQDRKSDYWLPNHYNNRKSARSDHRELESPPYDINAESINFSDSLSGRPWLDEIQVTEWLVDKTADKDFHLERKCHGCTSWKPVDLARPKRKGAVEAATSCFGCWYGHLDGGNERYSKFDRDAASNWYSATRARMYTAQCRLADSKSEAEKKKIGKALKWLESEEKRALRACHVLGFDPRHKRERKRAKQKSQHSPTAPPEAAIRETQAHAIEDLRQDQAVVALAHAKLATCSSCSAWCHEESISKPSKRMGFCWARDEMKTAEDYWCPEYKFGGDR